MGQGSSSRHKTTDFSKSESTLEFEPGKKLITHSQQSFDRSITPIDREPRPPPSVVSDDDEDELLKQGKPRRRLTVPTVFRWEYGGKEVYLSGSFNEWKTRIPMSYSGALTIGHKNTVNLSSKRAEKGFRDMFTYRNPFILQQSREAEHIGGEFTAIIELLAGEHHYKFLVDGHWIHDPNQPTVNDTFGGRNNVVNVKDSDFDVGEALDEDSGKQKGSFASMRQISPPGSYGQLIPSHHTPVVVHDTLHSAVPPMLPPHLLNVILNKEAIDQEDLTLLPVPHHVALNHLYALSIKDGVMTLSATHRYRRKYVTTVLYRPVK